MRFLLAVVLSATASVPVVAQSVRTSFAGENAIRGSYGRAFPIGDEDLAHSWSAGPSFSGSWEHFPRGSIYEHASFGIIVEHSSHPFDAVGFLKGTRCVPSSVMACLPSVYAATFASGQAATVTNIGGLVRLGFAFKGTLKRVLPFMLLGLGSFTTNRGDVFYSGPSGSGTLTMGSKSGLYAGLSFGADIAFGNSALSLEGGWSSGGSEKDDTKNVDYVICSSGGCSTPKKYTQVVSIRVGVRQILTRAKGNAR